MSTLLQVTLRFQRMNLKRVMKPSERLARETGHQTTGKQGARPASRATPEDARMGGPSADGAPHLPHIFSGTGPPTPSLAKTVVGAPSIRNV